MIVHRSASSLVSVLSAFCGNIPLIMWIKTIVILCCAVTACLAIDEHRPKRKEEARGKRNLHYNIAHHYSGPFSFNLERRISNSPQLPLYHTPYFPGPRSYSPYLKGRPYSLPAPPYAVQMEPLVQYSQRDPLYDTNVLSLNADAHQDITKTDDLLTDNNHLTEHVYGPPHPPQKHVIERPVYIKEPEPIIEIIIKESNVSLPAPHPPPPQPPKKKEEVQVFYVKYQKNPNGHGKDSIIYDKPVPAISPPVDDHHEEESPPQQYHHHEVVTSPPPPSTTLRTIIRPDSETYHGPSGIKVTFGKEGFDYDKRSNKPEDLAVSTEATPRSNSVQFPQARQLSTFPGLPALRRPPSYNFPPTSLYRSEHPRQTQQYRPFSHPPSSYRPVPFQFPRSNPPPTQYSTLPKHLQYQPQQSKNHGAPQRPVPPQFHQQPESPRQPVPYQPFESFRQQPQSPQPPPRLPPQNLKPHQNIQFRPQTHFPTTQLPPLAQKPLNFNQFPSNFHQGDPNSVPHIQPAPQTLPQQQFSNSNFPQSHEQRLPQQQQHQKFNPQNQQPLFNPQSQQPQFSAPHNQQSQFNPQNQQPQYNSQNQQVQQQVQGIIPPGGQLIHSLPRYEQHISIFQNQGQQSQAQPEPLPLQPHDNTPHQINNNHLSQSQYNEQIQEQFRQANALQDTIRQQSTSQQSQAQPQQQHNQLQQQPQHQQQPQFQQQPQIQQQPQLQQQPQIQQQPQLQQQSQLQQHPQLQQQYFKIQQSISEERSPENFYQTTSKPATYINNTPRFNYQSTTERTTTTTVTEEPEKPTTTTKDPKVLNAQLPDEVPEDLRQQLLSSGILNHADISVLDYDKVGDIPLSALPADQLANFYSAGGAQQISAGSAPVPQFVKKDGGAISKSFEEEGVEEDEETDASEIQEVRAPPEVQMKVVRYDPQSEQGQQVQEAYVKTGATQVDPVVLNDAKYNRYLPLKVSGAQFPIPDVPELKGKKISSVVVLAPVAYAFSSARKARQVRSTPKEIDLIQGFELRELLKRPTSDNYKKFLDSENRTESDKQAVILLVTGSNEKGNEKEIFMYDVASQTVSKLSGELSEAFVEAAEANATEENEDEKTASSNVIETRVPYSGGARNSYTSDVDLEGSASDIFESRVPIIDPMEDELEAEGSEHLQSFVDVSGMPVDAAEDLTASASEVKYGDTISSVE